MNCNSPKLIFAHHIVLGDNFSAKIQINLKFYLIFNFICVIIFWQFEIALIAQLDRVSDYESEGRGFESLSARQKKHLSLKLRCFFN